MSPEAWSATTALFALVVAVFAVVFSGMQANAAKAQAESASASARAAFEEVDVAKEQTLIARRQLDSMEQARKESLEPYVVVDFEPHESGPFILNLAIQNVGSTVARNVRFRFEPELVAITGQTDNYKIADTRILREGVPMMPPGRKITMFFDSTFEIAQANINKQYRVYVDCEGPFGVVETQVYDIDADLLSDTIQSDLKNVHHVADNLKKVADHLAKIESHLKKATQAPRSTE